MFHIKGIKCSNCVVWANSDSLSRDVIKLAFDVLTTGKMTYSGVVLVEVFKIPN